MQSLLLALALAQHSTVCLLLFLLKGRSLKSTQTDNTTMIYQPWLLANF
jgi:hypothetical protein